MGSDLEMEGRGVFGLLNIPSVCAMRLSKVSIASSFGDLLC